MNVLKTARKLRKELKKRGYPQTVEQCKYYVRDVLSKETTLFHSDDYVVNTFFHARSFKEDFSIDLSLI